MNSNEIITQTVTIKAEGEKIFKELIMWGESEWWPKNCLMEFNNLSENVKEGTLYFQRVKLPFKLGWHTRNEVVDKERLYIKRTFLDGMFEGFEELKIVALYENLCEVVYSFCYRVKGIINQLMWKVVFRRLHINNINAILKSLKGYLENS
jgi:hypothetical protein